MQAGIWKIYIPPTDWSIDDNLDIWMAGGLEGAQQVLIPILQCPVSTNVVPN